MSQTCLYENELNVYFGHNNTSLMGWVGCEFDGMGWVWLIKMDPCPCLALRAQLFCKSGARPRTLWFRTHCLGHGPSVMVWGQGIWKTEVPQFGPGAKPGIGVWCPPPIPAAICKMGARALVPYGVGATVSDILLVNPAGVIDVY